MPETAHSQSFKSQPDNCAPFPPVHVMAEIEKREVRKAGKTGREARISSAWPVQSCPPQLYKTGSATFSAGQQSSAGQRIREGSKLRRLGRNFSKGANRQGSWLSMTADRQGTKLGKAASLAGQEARHGSKFGRAGNAAGSKGRQGRKCGRPAGPAGRVEFHA